LEDIDLGEVLATLNKILELRIFKSEAQARAYFPELFASSPTRQTQRAESECATARSAAELIDNVVSIDAAEAAEHANVTTEDLEKLIPGR
jgi:hypothetical protein